MAALKNRLQCAGILLPGPCVVPCPGRSGGWLCADVVCTVAVRGHTLDSGCMNVHHLALLVTSHRPPDSQTDFVPQGLEVGPYAWD